MRRFLSTAVVLTLCTFLLTTGAQAMGPARHMPPNELLITKALKARGVIPATATAAEADAIVRAYIESKVGTKPEDRANKPAPTLPTNEYPGFGTNQHGDYNILGGISTDHALVLLVDFGGPWKGKSGPLHGEILPPAAGDNTTFWPGDFSTTHYQNMLFGDSFPVFAADGSLRGSSTNTFKKYYLEQSHGTYTVTGNIADWVTVPYPESYYGKDSGSDTDSANGPVWRVAQDAVAALAAREPDFPWADYDHENPWGIVPGGFNQPDGYVDHLILVHAGADQSAGGGVQGDDAIWAHSWWVDSANGMGPGRSGGYQIPGSSLWIGPYTINPEDGGIGVFAHEFGHDLGLPDQYNYDGDVEATPGFWSLMDSGSWLGDSRWGLDTAPAPMDAWSKYYLGWVDPVVVARGATARATLPPSAFGDFTKTTVRIDLPAAQYTVSLSGADGNAEWYSDMGDNLNNKMTTASKIALPAVSPSLSFTTWYDIESGYDYGMVEVSTDGLAYTSVAGNLTSSAGSGVYGITGTSSGWVSASYDLSAWAGQSVYLRFRYFTDGGVAQKGWEVDNVAVSGGAFSDTADSAATMVASPAVGWSIVDGQKTKTATRYYIADYRTRLGFDAYLANCYNFLPGTNTAEFFKYNTGLVLQYRNTGFLDNEVLYHPGEGGWTYVDSHPKPDSYLVPTSRKKSVRVYWRTRIQMRDAAFGLLATPEQILLDKALPGFAGQPVFNDSLPYWYAEKGDSGAKLPALGTSFKVTAQNTSGLTLTINNGK